MFIKNYVTFIIIIVLLAGCTSNDTKELIKEVERLEAENTQLIHTINQLETELENFEQTNKDLEQETYMLKELVDEYVDAAFKNDFNVYNEGFYIEPVLMLRDDLTLEQIKNIMGEPNNLRNYIEKAHCGCQETEVIYDNASFTFQGELIKWMTLNDTTFVTQRGITVGSTKEQVIESYGENYLFQFQDGSINYGEKTGIRFSIDENVVSEITVWYMYE